MMETLGVFQSDISWTILEMNLVEEWYLLFCFLDMAKLTQNAVILLLIVTFGVLNVIWCWRSQVWFLQQSLLIGWECAETIFINSKTYRTLGTPLMKMPFVEFLSENALGLFSLSFTYANQHRHQVVLEIYKYLDISCHRCYNLRHNWCKIAMNQTNSAMNYFKKRKKVETIYNSALNGFLSGWQFYGQKQKHRPEEKETVIV